MKRMRWAFAMGGGTVVGLVLLLVTAALAISVPLPPATYSTLVPLPSTTAATEPDLAGVVLQDALRPFTISYHGQFQCSGELQDRVVRSNATGQLHFYFRIRNTRSGTLPTYPAYILRIVRSFFGVRFGGNLNEPVEVAYRTDGLGGVAPDRTFRLDSSIIYFLFHATLASPPFSCAGQESRFILVKTRATSFSPDQGSTVIVTTHWATTVQTAVPLP